jgi:SAM-dependent methyltransferase
MTSRDRGRDASVIWHQAECGGYTADLTLWEELARGAGPILDLGCGTGRVSLYLARREHRIVGVDLDPAFIAALTEAAGGLSMEAQVGDAREFDLAVSFGLALAPMQLLQLFAGADERARCLRCVADHLAPGGVAAFAIVESMPEPVDAPPPLPDTREVDGWVYSSLPVDVALGSDEIRIRRLRQTVSPAGELSEELDEVLLHPLDAARLEREAEAVGLRAAGRRQIPATDAHVGSTAVLLAKEA